MEKPSRKRKMQKIVEKYGSEQNVSKYKTNKNCYYKFEKKRNRVFVLDIFFHFFF